MSLQTAFSFSCARTATLSVFSQKRPIATGTSSLTYRSSSSKTTSSRFRMSTQHCPMGVVLLADENVVTVKEHGELIICVGVLHFNAIRLLFRAVCSSLYPIEIWRLPVRSQIY